MWTKGGAGTVEQLLSMGARLGGTSKARQWETQGKDHFKQTGEDGKAWRRKPAVCGTVVWFRNAHGKKEPAKAR